MSTAIFWVNRFVQVLSARGGDALIALRAALAKAEALHG